MDEFLGGKFTTSYREHTHTQYQHVTGVFLWSFRRWLAFLSNVSIDRLLFGVQGFLQTLSTVDR